MRWSLIAVLLGVVVISGCLGGTVGGSPSPAPSTVGASEPTASASTTGERSFAYVVRAGGIPDGIAHVYLDLAVYLAERPGDVVACTEGAPLFDNRYDPEPTPVRTPAGDCETVEVPRIDLAAVNGSRTLGPFSRSDTYAGGHSLVVHDLTIVLENGSTATAVHDTDFRAVFEESPAAGRYGVLIGVTDHRGAEGAPPWRFGIEVERFDP